MPVTIRILGTFAVVRDGAPVGPPGDALKRRTLLALLALRANSVVSKESLIDELWTDPPPSARNLVEKHVSWWRKVLDPEQLATVGRGYQLNVDAAACDLENLRALLKEGRRAVEQGDHAGAAATFCAAFELWSSGDVEAYTEDLLPANEAAHLVDLYLRTLENWAAAALEVGGEPRVVEPLRRAWNRHPFRERLAELLMWAYVQAGQQADAGEVYRATSRRLADELGQNPSATLREMYARVLRQDENLAGSAAAVAPRLLGNLPARTGRFIGRNEELAAIAGELHRSSPGERSRAVAVWGGVGVGKSALALEYAYRHRARYRVIWHVNAPTRTSVNGDLGALGERLRVPSPPEDDSFLPLLWERLEQAGRWLLIFDNAVPSPEFASVWPAAAGGEVLITSLNPDWGQYAHSMQLRVLSPEETVRFLQERTGLRSPDGDSALARELDGLPLACEQAASYMRQTGMTTTEYLPLFRRRRSQLLQRGVPDDHAGTIETTWRLASAELSGVSPAAVQLVLLCAHLAAEDVPLRWLREGAAHLPWELRQAVHEDLELEDVIRAARKYSLLGREGDRLRMHCLLQAVVAGSLPADERARWRARGAGWLVAVSAAAADDLRLFVPHVSFVAQGLQDAADLVPGLLDLIHRNAEYLVARGSFEDARVLLESLLPAASSSREEGAAARTLVLLGEVLEQQLGLTDALSAYERALSILPPGADAKGSWAARASSGIVRTLTCHDGVSQVPVEDRDAARERFEKALATLRVTLGPDHPAVARSLSGLGQIRQDLGDIAGGVACQETALAIIERSYGPEHPETGHLHDKLGYALRLRGDLERARRSHLRACEILVAAYGDGHPETGWPLSNLGVLLLEAGEVAESIACQRRAHDIFAGARDERIATHISLWRLGRAYLADGRTEEAVSALAEAAAELRSALGERHDDAVAARADLERARSVAVRA